MPQNLEYHRRISDGNFFKRYVMRKWCNFSLEGESNFNIFEYFRRPFIDHVHEENVSLNSKPCLCAHLSTQGAKLRQVAGELQKLLVLFSLIFPPTTRIITLKLNLGTQ